MTSDDVNKGAKPTDNGKDYKFIETINNNNERNNTVQANLNTVVHLTNNDKDNKNTKVNTSINKSL